MDLSIGIYFISTHDAMGEMARYKLNISYNIIGIQLDSTYPGDNQHYIYFYDVMTNQAPYQFKNSMRYTEWIKINYSQKNIKQIVFKYFTITDDYDTIKKELKKFISKHCLTYSSAPNFDHWKSINHAQWHPEKSIPIFQYAMSQPMTMFYDDTPSNEMVHYYMSTLSTHNDKSIMVELESQWKHHVLDVFDMYHNVQTADITLFNFKPLIEDMMIVSKKNLMKLHDHVSLWCKSISQKTTPIILLNEVLSVLQEVLPSANSLPRSLPNEGSLTGLIVLTASGSPIELTLPEHDMSNPIVLSLLDPDVSLLTDNQVTILTNVLHSDPYITDAKYDLIRAKLIS